MNAKSFRPDIQGVRAIAVLSVVIFHFNPAWLPSGFIGVDIFLVISGFLITSILLNNKAKSDYSLLTTLKHFYTSRFKRIAPAYFTMLVLVALFAAVFFLPQDFRTFKDGLEKAALFNSNNYFADFGDYFAPSNHEQPLLHTWSLAVEIQFYLLAPFLILLLPSNALKWVLGCAVIGLTLIAEYRMRILGLEQATYYSLYARLPEFFAGALVALHITSVPEGNKSLRWPAWVGLGLVIVAVVAPPALGVFPGLSVLLPVAGSVLLIAYPANGAISRLLCSKTLVWIGTLSYSLYLWHWPVLAFLRYYSGAEVLDLTFSFLFLFLTLGLSIASYYGVEQAFKSKQFSKKQALRWGVLIAIIFGTSQSMAKVNKAFTPEQLPIEYRRYADPAFICHGKMVGTCLQGDLISEREVLVLGDSHAAMLNHFFDYLGKELGFKARIITASSCVTIPGFDYQRIADFAHKPCLAQIEAAAPFIDESQTIFIAGAWNFQTKSPIFKAVLMDFLRNQRDKRIIILSQVPRFERNVSQVQRFSDLGLPADLERDLSYRTANRELADIAKNYINVEFKELDTLPVFRDAPFYQGQLIYHDEHHVNEVGAQAYAVSAVSLFTEILPKQ